MMPRPPVDQRGHVLLVAAAPRSARRRLLDPEAGTAAIGSVPAEILLGTRVPADAVTLVDPGEPQAVLGRIRKAAATPGPVALYLAGQLVADRRRRELHLALAETSGLNIRYTALPWEWIRRELTTRPHGARTVVLVDLVAEAEAWAVLQADPGALALPPEVELWGVVCPPPARRTQVAPGYSRALGELMRTSVGRSRFGDLHALAAGQAHLPPQALLLAPARPAPVPVQRIEQLPASAPALFPRPARPPLVPVQPSLPPVPVPVAPVADVDPRPAVAEALRAGRFPLAAALVQQWEQRVLRTTGPTSRAAADVAEAQAHVAAASGDIRTGTVRWIVAARILRQHLAANDPELAATVDNAHALWAALPPAPAVELGPELVELRQAIDPDGRRLADVHRRLDKFAVSGDDFLLQQPLR